MNNETNKNLCIIPARGGSKRIPRKNIKIFLGKPIIAYSIEAALKSFLFEEVMVSTDDEEIANIAIKYGATVPFLRSTNTADDFATTSDVINEVLFQYDESDMFFDNICCVYPCAPFVTSQKLIKSYQLLTERQFEAVFSVMQFSYPIQRALQIQNNRVSYIQPEFASSRSQDLEKAYQDTGQFYWFTSKSFKINNKIVTDKCGAIIVSELEVQDIDNETDWKLAEMKIQLLIENNQYKNV
jgi:pseudaminic acid cytidylyltransferase